MTRSNLYIIFQNINWNIQKYFIPLDWSAYMENKDLRDLFYALLNIDNINWICQGESGWIQTKNKIKEILKNSEYFVKIELLNKERRACADYEYYIILNNHSLNELKIYESRTVQSKKDNNLYYIKRGNIINILDIFTLKNLYDNKN